MIMAVIFGANSRAGKQSMDDVLGDLLGDSGGE